MKTEGVSSKEFVVTCKQCWKTFYFHRDYAKHLPCYVRQSKLKLDFSKIINKLQFYLS